MPMLHLRFLGVPEINLDGQPVRFARRASIGLLAYLALSGRPHARESLAAMLAGDSSQEQARKHLSNVLIDLRQHTGHYMTTTRDTVAFASSFPHQLDVTEFQRRVVRSLDGDSFADLVEPIEMYRGEFLSGLSLPGAPDFEAWLFAMREQLRGQYLLALRSQIESAIRDSAWNTGIPAARRLIAEEPWLEEAHRDLMLMLARSGQRHAAISQYHACRRVLREELGVDPQPPTTALYNRLRAADRRPAHNLPVPSTPLIGRTDELRLLCTLLADPDCRLATIAGLGGSGKTRLAIEVGRAYAAPLALPPEQPFADGIILVCLADSASASNRGDLSAAEAEDTIVAAIHSALELPESSDGPKRARVLAHLRSRAMLLILDNFEHLGAGVAALSGLLAQAPDVKVLVTSRAPLHAAGERVLLLEGLALPSNAEELEAAEASALFLAEARRVHLGFELSCAERRSLVDLCQAVGGFPLALILAARWTPMLTCSQVLAELSRGLDVLATTEPDLPERHRSVGAIFDNALSRLTYQDRALARSLAEAGRSVAALHDVLPIELLHRVRPLREQALLSGAVNGGVCLHPLLQRYVEATRPRRAPVCAA